MTTLLAGGVWRALNEMLATQDRSAGEKTLVRTLLKVENPFPRHRQEAKLPRPEAPQRCSYNIFRLLDIVVSLLSPRKREL